MNQKTLKVIIALPFGLIFFGKIQAVSFSVSNIFHIGENILSENTVAALKINFGTYENGKKLNHIKLTLSDINNSGTTWHQWKNTSSDLANLSTGKDSGIMLYKDHPTKGTPDAFDKNDDLFIPLFPSPTYKSENFFILTPFISPTINKDDTFFVVISIKENPNFGHRFTLSIEKKEDIVVSGTSVEVKPVPLKTILIAIPEFNPLLHTPKQDNNLTQQKSHSISQEIVLFSDSPESLSETIKSSPEILTALQETFEQESTFSFSKIPVKEYLEEVT